LRESVELSFMDAYTLWCGLPFPPVGSTQELKALRGYLGVADEYATVVRSSVLYGRFRKSSADVVEELCGVIARANALCAEYSGDDLRVAREIRAYAALLKVVYQRFLEAGEAGSASFLAELRS
jgi:hypothetical protein